MLRAWVEEARRTLGRQEGQTLLEYSLTIGFIAMSAVVSIILLAPAIVPAFQAVTDVIEEYVPL
jgi:Flp pilus assembly pilin Flp